MAEARLRQDGSGRAGSPEAAAMVKIIRDRLAARPGTDSPGGAPQLHHNDGPRPARGLRQREDEGRLRAARAIDGSTIWLAGHVIALL